jgi:hypothetical protein
MKEKYPEHEKLHKVKDLSQSCGEFLDWLQNEKFIRLCTLEDERTINEDEEDEEELPAGFYQINQSNTSLLAEYFGIDPNKLEEEKRQMLDEIRTANVNSHTKR